MSGLLLWVRAAWDRLLGYAAIILGGVLVAAGYLGVSGTGRIPAQVSYLASGSLGGLVLLVCGGGVVLSADLRDQWRKARRLESLLTAGEVVLPDEAPDPESPNSDLPPGTPVPEPVARPSRIGSRT